MSDGWDVTENDRAAARWGIELQAKARGIDVNTPLPSIVISAKALREFIDNQVEVMASWSAQARWQQNHIHDMTFNLTNFGHRGPQDGEETSTN